MPAIQPLCIKTITEYHQVMGLPKPEHPLITVINLEDVKRLSGEKPRPVVFGFYSISLKRNFDADVKYRYGQQEYDFDEGVMFFIAPGQVFAAIASAGYQLKGWLLLVHPDFLWNTPLAKKIKHHGFFSYSVHEALHLSEKEENMVIGIMHGMANEYHANIDRFSQDVILAQLNLLLTYAERFYQRQFITRKISNHKVLERLETILVNYFGNENVSPNYLSGLLKVLTGKSTQQHIHEKLIEMAKEKLSATDLSVSEIAYALGFGHPQSFSKLFRTKTNFSPLEFRQAFN